MPGEGEQITTPRDQVDLPKLLEDLHAVPTQLATENPPKVFFIYKAGHTLRSFSVGTAYSLLTRRELKVANIKHFRC